LHIETLDLRNRLRQNNNMHPLTCAKTGAAFATCAGFLSHSLFLALREGLPEALE